ncbi:MAG: hypothetical protein JOZ69_08930 [Myxococcales bacterium]|nr:hypothetical protein [Myxococcales bacterium]
MIHHTNCGMELFSDELMDDLLGRSLETAKHDGQQWVDAGKGPGSREAQYADWPWSRHIPHRNELVT